DLLHATTRLGPARGYFYQLIATIGWTSLPMLPRLRPPTLILAGDDDPIIPVVNARIMRRLIPRSELQVYHGGHLELAADAERLAATVEAFLDADPTAGGSQQLPRSLALTSGNPSARTSSRSASSSPTSSGRTSSPSGGSSTRRSCRSPAGTGNGPRSAGRWSGGCPSSASSARTSGDTGAPG
ncbi:MAG TPA: alpha/beta fold hydrolase, partial [Streptosporangiaceae bacterium]